MALRSEISDHYAAGVEEPRLASGPGKLELVRTQELLHRHLPSPPAAIADLGGGPGVYSCWLATLGYQVHLVDAMPQHVEQAQAASARQPAHPLASAQVGDGRALPLADESVDAVLLMGPLYHLPERADRVQAWREARRIVRPGGVICAAVISRFASTLDGVYRGYLADTVFRRIVEQDLATGRHESPDNDPRYFTTAYFHHPDELRGEIEAAGLAYETLLGVEGPGWLFTDFDARWNDATAREQILLAARHLESDPAILALSPHLLAIARRA